MRGNDSADVGGRAFQLSASVTSCAECGSLSGPHWWGWRAYRVDDPDTNEPQTLALYCPTCADKEFGYSRRV
jgi:hypothetical protein